MLLAAENAVTMSGLRAPLEAFATEARLEVAVVHFPPGTWRWQRSARQATCSCSLHEAKGGAEVEASLALVLPDVGPS
jgi:hypothetical protein